MAEAAGAAAADAAAATAVGVALVGELGVATPTLGWNLLSSSLTLGWRSAPKRVAGVATPPDVDDVFRVKLTSDAGVGVGVASPASSDVSSVAGRVRPVFLR